MPMHDGGSRKPRDPPPELFDILEQLCVPTSIYCVTFHGRMESILPRTMTYIPPLVVLLSLLQSSRSYHVSGRVY